MTVSTGRVYYGKSSLCVSFCSHDPTETSEVRRSERLKWYFRCFVFVCLSVWSQVRGYSSCRWRQGCRRLHPRLWAPRTGITPYNIGELGSWKNTGEMEPGYNPPCLPSDPLLPAKLCLLGSSIPPNRFITENHEFKHKRLRGTFHIQTTAAFKSQVKA